MYKFKVKGLNCMSCYHNIKDSLQEFDSEINVEVQVKEQLIFTDQKWPILKLKELIEAAGYPVLSFEESA